MNGAAVNGSGGGPGHARPSSLQLERGGEAARNLQSWLQALPRIGKSNFSPWDDDEPIGGAGGSANGSLGH